MEFPVFTFDELGEADVREEIVAPLIRHLGYRSGSEHPVIREQALSYDRLSLVRRKSVDPVLRGRAAYICEAGRRVRWVIEAKAPNSPIDARAREQAWSFANHPEIDGVYFAITNGREFHLYRTGLGPDSAPVLVLAHERWQQSLQALEVLLRPEVLLAKHAYLPVDQERAIGPGLRSIVRITSGGVTTYELSGNHPQLDGTYMGITGGSIERVNQRLVVHMSTQVPLQRLQDFNERVGLSNLVLRSEASALSADPRRPTRFVSSEEVFIARGCRIFDLATWQDVIVPANITMTVITVATGYLVGKVFEGKFTVDMHPSSGTAVRTYGHYKIHLS